MKRLKAWWRRRRCRRCRRLVRKIGLATIEFELAEEACRLAGPENIQECRDWHYKAAKVYLDLIDALRNGGIPCS